MKTDVTKADTFNNIKVFLTDYAPLLDRLENGQLDRIADAPPIMALLGYECQEHRRLGIACRPINVDGPWQALPRFDSADDAAIWIKDGFWNDIGREENGLVYAGFENRQHGNDYGYGKSLGIALWAAFVALAGQVERGD